MRAGKKESAKWKKMNHRKQLINDFNEPHLQPACESVMCKNFLDVHGK